MIQSFDISLWIGERPLKLIHLTQKENERKHLNHWNQNPNSTKENRGYPYVAIIVEPFPSLLRGSNPS
jgi:hypothetical protein